MKRYEKPELKVVVLKNTICMLKSSLGNEYDSDAQSYTRQDNALDIWGEAQDDEEDW